MKKKTVILGFVGTTLDSGNGSARWEKWRPTVAMAQHEDLVADRFELLYNGSYGPLVQQVAQDIATVSPETAVTQHKLHIRDPWDFGDVYGALFDFARSYPFDPDKEEYWVHITTGTHVVQICLFLMTEARYFPGCLLQTSPPRRHAAGSPGNYTLIDLDLSRYDQIAQRFATAQQEGVAFLKSGIATRNPQFNLMIDEIEHVAVRSRAPMLLMGPTGAGSTLFGHVRGAFTGAASDRPGLLRTAHKGLLFLDEIGELGLDEQAMLLKAVEEKRFLPMGGDHEVQSDFQLIAGTNRDLAAEVAAGRFREDLYARINLWTYALPGLSDRPEDIEPNLDYLLQQYSAEHGNAVRFNKEAREQFMAFAASPDARWSGNFRDLSAAVTRMATLAEAGRITTAVAGAEIARLQRQWRTLAPAATAPAVALEDVIGKEAAAQIDLFDRVQLEAVLAVCRQSRTMSDAGRKLYAVSRAEKAKPNDADRLRKYLARFGLEWEQVAPAA